MQADLLLRQRMEVDDLSFAELVVWQLPRQLPGSTHGFKYRLVYVVEGICVLRYENESGKGDHRHLGQMETAYRFSTVAQLVDDFWKDVETAR
jgi:hypothetical protein